MRTFRTLVCWVIVCLTLSYTCCADLINGGFEAGLAGWIHDQNTYPIGTAAQPIGTEGVTTANLGTFDQTGSEIYQDVSLDIGSYQLRFSLGANSGFQTGRTAAINVVISLPSGALVSKEFSVVSSGYPSQGLGFIPCEVEFTVENTQSVRLKFLDVSPNRGVSVDPMIDNVVLIKAEEPKLPSLTRQPVSQMLKVGESSTLAVVATGSEGLLYQWYKNGEKLQDATNSYFLLKSVQNSSAGNYQVVVRSRAGETVSDLAHVDVFDGANLLLNGSFENGLLAWEHDSAVYEIAAGVEGNKAANLGTFDQPFSFISQEVAVSPNASYVVSFASAANAVYAVGLTSRILLEASTTSGDKLLSQIIEDVSAGLPGGPRGFTRRSFVLQTGDGVGHLAITFRDSSPDGGRSVDQMIDDVRLERVNPDPRTRIIVPKAAALSENSGASSAFSVPTRVQEVYSAANFPNLPIVINELRFRPDSFLGFAFDGLSDYVRFTMSSTRTLPGNLSMRFDENLGGDKSVVYEGPWMISTAFIGSGGGPRIPDIILPLQKPFRYDPTDGNLLLEVRTSSILAKRFHHDSFILGESGQRISAEGDSDAVYANLSEQIVDVVQIAYVPDPSVPPTILRQPIAGTVQKGNEVTLNVDVNGSSPLTYQWIFEGRAIPNATNQTLTLRAVSAVDSGFYSVRVSNVSGSVNSAAAFLFVQYPPSIVVAQSSRVEMGGMVDVPILFGANGVEKSLAFSLGFPSEQLRFISLEVEGGSGNLALTLHTNELAFGRLGVELRSQGDSTFQTGTSLVCRVRFHAEFSGLNSSSANVNFGSSPVLQQVLDFRGRPLLSTFEPAQIAISFNGLEGDVESSQMSETPLNVLDWVRAGRYLVGLDRATNNMLLRKLDSAPRPTLGDGKLTAADWVQAGRYISGTDPLTPVGGPEQWEPTLHSSDVTGLASESINITLGNPLASEQLEVVLPLLIDARGTEAALSFSLGFDPSKLTFKEVELTKYSRSWKLLVNDRDAALGRLGIAVAPLYPKSFVAGISNEVVKFVFQKRGILTRGSFYFSDVPAPRSVADKDGLDLPVSFGGPYVGLPPDRAVLEYRDAGEFLEFSWERTRDELQLQSRGFGIGGEAEWLVVTGSHSNFGNRSYLWVRKNSRVEFFRLAAPPGN